MNRVNRILENKTFKSTLDTLAKAEKKRIFCKHNIEHLLDVARIMYIFSLENNISIDKEIIYATALLHDIGRERAYRLHTDHAVESSKIAGEVLKECGFSFDEIEKITSAVSHHNDKENADELCTILRFADKKSRNCFMCSAYAECNWSEDKRNKGVEL